jgi:Bardet-Biedl syndrome 2 protein
VRTNGSKFAYGLANGTVGCHDGIRSRLWRAKTKHELTALAAYDIDGDGVKEIICGWSNGSFQVRRESNGDILFKDSPSSSGQQQKSGGVAAIITADYRLTGKEELIVCMQSGEVKGFVPSDVDLAAALEKTSSQSKTGVNAKNIADQEALAELQAKKLELMNELKLLEKTAKYSKPGVEGIPGALPSGTSIAYNLEPLVTTRSVQLSIEATTDVLITNVVVVDKGSNSCDITIKIMISWSFQFPRMLDFFLQTEA